MRRLSPSLIVARRREVHLARPLVDAPLATWRQQGGRLFLDGPDGSGRRRLLDVQEAELRTAGCPAVRLAPSPDTWSPVVDALQTAALPGPQAEIPRGLSPARRAEAAATLLLQRSGGAVWVLVEDADRLDSGTALTLSALRRHPGVHIVSFGGVPTSDATVLPLPALSDGERRSLVDRLLGRGQPSSVDAWLQAAGARWPGDVIDLLVCGVAEGVLLAGSSGELVATGPAPDCTAGRANDALLADLPPVARSVLEVLAASAAPVEERRLPGVVALGADPTLQALDRLRSFDLVHRYGGWVRIRHRAPERATSRSPVDRRRVHACLVPLAAACAPPLRLARHLEGAERADLVGRYGAEALAALRTYSPEDACARGRRLVALQPDALPVRWELVQGLVASRHSTEAMQVAETALLDGGAVPAVAPMLALAALSVLDRDADESTARALTRQARSVLAGQPAPAELHLVEARLLLRSGKYGQALATARRGLQATRPDTLGPDECLVGLRLIEGESMARAGNLDGAVSCLRAAPPGEGSPAREPLLVSAGRILRGARRYLAAADCFAEAARNDPHSVGADQVGWLQDAAASLYSAGDRLRAAETWEAALDMAERTTLKAPVTTMRIRLASVLHELCRFESAAEQAARAHEEALLSRAPSSAATAALTAADIALAREDWDGVRRWVERAAQASDPQRPRMQARLDRRRAELAVRTRSDTAERLAAAAVQSARLAVRSGDLALAHAMRAVTLARAGHVDQIEATLERALPPLRSSGAAHLLAEARLWAADAWLAAGQNDRAADEATRALVWADEVGHLLFHQRATALAQRARSRGDHLEDGAALNRLLETAVALGRERDLSTLLDQIADAAMHLTEADRAYVVLTGEPGTLEVAAARIAPGVQQGGPSLSVVHKALDHGREVVVSDVAERSDLRLQDSIVHLKVRSAMCVPLSDSSQPIGALYVDSHEENQQVLGDSLRLLRALAAQASVAVTNARLLAESRRRADWAAEMAHDLGAPMAAVALAAEELAATPGLAASGLDAAQLIREQAEQVMRMAERYLADRAGVSREVDLADRVRRQVEVAGHKARSRGQRVEFHVREEPIVELVPESLDRIVTNLLSNASNHTPPGTAVQVEVGALRGEAVLVVRDHGPGIPDELLGSIFERGRQAGEKRRGHGLGLAIVRRLVSEAGGTVSATNHPLGGAEFRIRLPMLRRNPDLKAEA